MEWLKYNLKNVRLVFLITVFFSAMVVQAASPVLITFDVEEPGDKDDLEELNITVPATYFFLGKFIEKNTDLVAALAKNNTVGSHAYSFRNLTELSGDDLYLELKYTKELLEKATGEPPRWFRAPFLEYNDDVMSILKELGFHYDSSGDERWMKQEKLIEIPISRLKSTDRLVSDYNFFIKDQLSDEVALEWYKQGYLEQSKTGRPFVLLFHPSIIVKHKEVLWRFIDFVQKEGGKFVTGDQWVRKLKQISAKRIGLWVDFTTGTHSVEQLIADIKVIGVTDVFLMAKDYEGYEYFSESKDNDNLFEQMYTALKTAGVRVHAWLPVLFDPRNAQLYPEAAMKNMDGDASIEWLSPSDTGILFLVGNTIEALLERYDIDGISLDYIRYPNLGYDFSDRAVSTFISEIGDKTLKKEDFLSKHYVKWTDWRTKQITRLVKGIREVINSSNRRGIELSASLIAQSSISYRSREKFGQDYSQLADYLDMIIPMAYMKEERKPVKWISDVIASSRYRIGNRELLVGLASYQKPKKWKITNREFENSVKLAAKGSEGVVFYNYLNLFGRGEKTQNMTAGNVDFLQHYLVETGDMKEVHSEKGTTEGYQFGPMPFSRPSPAIFILSLIVILLMFIIIFRILKKKGIYGQSLSFCQTNKVDVILSEIDFVALEKKIYSKKSITPEVFTEVNNILNTLGQKKISKFRCMRLLEIIKESPMDLNKLQHGLASFHNDLSALRRIEEEVLLGYLDIDDRQSTLTLTDDGLRELQTSIKTGGYKTDLINFIDHRLAEHIIITCPDCGAKTLGFWFWKDYECSGCNRKGDVIHAAHLSLKT